MGCGAGHDAAVVRAEALAEAPAVRWRDRRRLAKKRARAIEYSRGPDKKRQLYGELIAAAQASRAELQAVAAGLAEITATAVARWRAEVDHYLPLIARVITQSQRRVLDGEAVPAGEKLVSLFEPHADIIVKGGRQVQYGHKLNLAAGQSGLILDVVIETGNPADAERFLPMLDRHIARSGAPPRQTAADGAYASRANLAAAKARGVTDVAFHKKCGIAITEMVKSPGSTVVCATSAPASRRQSPASSAPTAPPAAPGAVLRTLRRMSGLPSWPTTWCCTPASNRDSAHPALWQHGNGDQRNPARRPVHVGRVRPRAMLCQREMPACDIPTNSALRSRVLEKTCLYGRALARS